MSTGTASGKCTERILSAAVFVAVLLAAPGAARAQTSLKATYNDGFILETDDGKFQLKIRGNLHFDVRAYQGEHAGSPSSFDIRRARIDLQGRLFRIFTFRLQPEFAGKPYIRNAWLDIGPLSWLHIRVGQMKVPFSSSWLTLDNNVNFVERGTSTPVYPFFDRGITLWGELLKGTAVYTIGVFSGAGIDIDYGSGDIDDFKDLAGRLFLQPFKTCSVKALQGLYLALGGTWGLMSVPTTRYETGGLRAANFESAIWRWRTEQVIGTDGRVTDRVMAEIDDRIRAGAELHYLYGPFSFSAEYLEVRYRGISLFHDLSAGSSAVAHEKLRVEGGAVRSFSVFISIYATGESKTLTNGGWKTPKPLKPIGGGGPGAWEILARYSRTWTDRDLFEKIKVPGFDRESAALPDDYSGPFPGASNSVSLSVLDGAHDVHEFTLGLCWILNPMVRIQLNDVLHWMPSVDRDGDGRNDNTMVSGAQSDQSNPEKKNTKVSWENAVMLRLILKI
ncbi:MAG: porin [Pseudomonadota bacterium]